MDTETRRSRRSSQDTNKSNDKSQVKTTKKRKSEEGSGKKKKSKADDLESPKNSLTSSPSEAPISTPTQNGSDSMPLNSLFVSCSTKRAEATSFNHAVGFIGYGAIGKAVLKNLLNSKCHIVFLNDDSDGEYFKDLVTDSNCEIVKSYLELFRKSDVIIWSATSMKESEKIFFDNLTFRKRLSGKYLIDLTYSNPLHAWNIYQTVIDEGGHYLEARFEGLLSDVQNGTALCLVSGQSEDFKICTPLFNIIAGKTYYCGDDLGKASKLSLLLNSLKAYNLAVVDQSSELAEKCMLEKASFDEMLSKNFVVPDKLAVFSKDLVEDKDKVSGTTLTVLQEALQSLLFTRYSDRVARARLPVGGLVLNHLNHLQKKCTLTKP